MLAEENNKRDYTSINVPRHVHNGLDAPYVPISSVKLPSRSTGTVTLSTEGQRYAFGVAHSNLTSITLYGSATRNDTNFTVSSANATAGAIYSRTSGGTTWLFQVVGTISGSTSLFAAGDPTTTATMPSSGTLTKVSGTGDNTITYSAYTDNGIRVRCSLSATALLQIGPSPVSYLQPYNASTVIVGDTEVLSSQSGQMFGINSRLIGSSDPVFTLVTQTNLVNFGWNFTTDRASTSNIVVKLRIPDETTDALYTQDFGGTPTTYDPSLGSKPSMALNVDLVTLAPGWEINGAFIMQ